MSNPPTANSFMSSLRIASRSMDGPRPASRSMASHVRRTATFEQLYSRMPPVEGIPQILDGQAAVVAADRIPILCRPGQRAITTCFAKLNGAGK